MKYPKNYIVWDLETSGLESSNDKILEIGAVKVVENEIVEEKGWLLNHDIEIPEIITEITGITKAMILKDGINPDLAISEFLEMFDSSNENLTHNGYRFDIPFLFKAMTEEQQVTYKEKVLNGCVDSAVLFKARELDMDQRWNENFLEFAERVMEVRAYGVKFNVSHCCNDLGIEISDTHRALGDVKLTNKIYEKLIHENRN